MWTGPGLPRKVRKLMSMYVLSSPALVDRLPNRKAGVRDAWGGGPKHHVLNMTDVTDKLDI
jgi:hypothetical protein